MRSAKKFPVALISIVLLIGCSRHKPLEVVKNMKVTEYLGTWYEIARLPHSFEDGLTCVTATYSMRDDGKIDVLNRGLIITGDSTREKIAHGVARIPDTLVQAKLKVSFYGPFYSDYQVIALGENYEYALVGTPSRKYLWILSRTPHIDAILYNSLIEIAVNKGFDTKRLEKVNQDCL